MGEMSAILNKLLRKISRRAQSVFKPAKIQRQVLIIGQHIFFWGSYHPSFEFLNFSCVLGFRTFSRSLSLQVQVSINLQLFTKLSYTVIEVSLELCSLLTFNLLHLSKKLQKNFGNDSVQLSYQQFLDHCCIHEQQFGNHVLLKIFWRFDFPQISYKEEQIHVFPSFFRFSSKASVNKYTHSIILRGGTIIAHEDLIILRRDRSNFPTMGPTSPLRRLSSHPKRLTYPPKMFIYPPKRLI